MSNKPGARARKQTRTDAAVAPRKQARNDGFSNPYTGHGTSRDRRRYTRHYTSALSDQSALDLRRGNWIAGRACELLDEDAFGKGYELSLEDKKLTEDVTKFLKKLGVNEKLKWAGQMERTVGGAALFPVLDGALGDISEPLDLENGPRIVAIKAIHQLEPRELTPVEWYRDMMHPKFRQPSHYRLTPMFGGGGGATRMSVVHESRLEIYPGLRFTNEVLPGQRSGWGDSTLNRSSDELQDFGLSWGSAATIIHNFSQRVIKYKGLMKMLERKDGESIMEARIRLMDMAANALRALPLDADDDFVNIAMSVAGLSDLLVQEAQLVCAAIGIPMTRMFGMQPAGLNATGEFDDQGWDDLVVNRQGEHTPHAERLIRMALLAVDGPTGGKEPDVWSMNWHPLKNQSPKEDAETRKLTAETDEIYYGMGAPAESILRSRFEGKYSRDTVIDWNNFDAQKKLDEQRVAAADAAALDALERGPDDGGEKPPAPGEKPKPTDDGE